MEYTGYYRIDVKWTLIFILGLLMAGYGCYIAFDDAAYHEMVETGRKRLLDYLPRPALQALMAGLTAAVVVFIPVHLHGVFMRRLAFAICADGVHAWPLLRKAGFIAWDEISTVQRIDHVLIFRRRGQGRGQNRQLFSYRSQSKKSAGGDRGLPS